MRATIPIMLATCLFLGACGAGRNGAAADACRTAIADKLGDKNFTLDGAAMARGASNESADIVHVSSTIVFDKGLSTEYAQTFDCRVRFENGKAPSVIGLQFNWSKADLKKANAEP